MPLQRVPFPDKVTERIVNAMFKELYDKLAFVDAKQTFKTQYIAAVTTADKLAVVAAYLGL